MKSLVKSFMLASLAILLASCNCYNKMLKKVDRVSECVCNACRADPEG